MVLLSRFGFQDVIPGDLQRPEIINPDQEVEVVGPASSNHLSQVASFRQALSEVQAQLQIQAQANSPKRSQPSTATPQATRSEVTPTIIAQPAILEYPVEIVTPSVATEDLGNGGRVFNEEVDYFRVATEMSSYMTGDIWEIPPWIDFDHQ